MVVFSFQLRITGGDESLLVITVVRFSGGGGVGTGDLPCPLPSHAKTVIIPAVFTSMAFSDIFVDICNYSAD